MSRRNINTTVLLTLLAIVSSTHILRGDDAQQGVKIADAKQLLKILAVSGQRKVPVLPETGKAYGDHSVNCRLNIPEKWRVSVSLSNNRKYLFLVFPCTNLAKEDGDIHKKLMIENRRMGLMRFEYNPSNNLVSLVYPVTNRQLDFDALDEMTRVLVREARRTAPLWSKAKRAVPKKNADVATESDSDDTGTAKTGPTKTKTTKTAGTKKTTARAMQQELSRRLHERLKTDCVANYSFNESSKIHTGVIQFNKNGTYRVRSTSDQKAKIVTGTWRKTARGIILTEKDGSSNDLFSPVEIENGKSTKLKMTFRYGTPARLPAASAPVLPSSPAATFFRQFSLELN